MSNDDDFLRKQKQLHNEKLKQRSLKNQLQTLCELVREVDEALEQVDRLKYYFRENKIDWVEEAHSICSILKEFCYSSPEFIQYKKDGDSDEYSFEEAINEGLSDLEIIFIDFIDNLYLTDPVLETHINDIETEICIIENLEEEHLTEFENLNETKYIVEMLVDEYKGACKDAKEALTDLYKALSKDPFYNN